MTRLERAVRIAMESGLCEVILAGKTHAERLTVCEEGKILHDGDPVRKQLGDAGDLLVADIRGLHVLRWDNSEIAKELGCGLACVLDLSLLMLGLLPAVHGTCERFVVDWRSFHAECTS